MCTQEALASEYMIHYNGYVSRYVKKVFFEIFTPNFLGERKLKC